MIKYMLLLVATGILASCTQGKGSKSETTSKIYTSDHYNITISSDLSNRLSPKLYPKAVSDADIVGIVGMNIYPRILTHKRSLNQLDQFRIDFINKKQINAYSVNTKLLEIDFSKFESQSERIKYLKTTFQGDERKFEGEFYRIHDAAIKHPFGSDIWTYLQLGVDGFIVNKEKTTSKIGINTFENRYKNVLILLTDGYIEAGIFGKNYDLSGKKINEFRIQFLKSGDKDIETFYKKNQRYKIHPLANPLLKDLEVLVLELYDRTETNSGASVHPTDLEIMRLIWGDWLKTSGVKKFGLYPKFSSKAEAEKIIFKFLGV